MSDHSQSSPAGVRIGRSALTLLLALVLVVTPLTGGRGAIAQTGSNGVQFVSGVFTTDNPLIMQLLSEPYFMLLDMTPYVNRDPEMAIPLESQIMAAAIGNLQDGELEFRLSLPTVPLGSLNDLDGDANDDPGVQLFSIEFGANTFGDPFMTPEEGTGWGGSFSSLIVTVPESQVVGGQVLVWAPDGEQSFSSGLGPDGIFLTDDDPVAPVEAGWTLIDLNSEPFEQVRDESVEVTLHPGDDGFTDLSDLSFTEAFTALIDELEIRYAFTAEKEIDWADLRATYLPMVEAAEADDDLTAFNNVITQFVLEFPDGHVGGTISDEHIEETIGGRLGMRLAETDDGEVIVTSVTPGLPADEAGIEVGATIIEWNGDDPIDAVEDAAQIITFSTDHARRLFQYEMLTRGPLGDTVEVTFQNEDDDEETVELTFSEDIEDRDARINATINVEDYDPLQLPVDAAILPSGIGYIRINTFYADPIMMTSAWNAAINTLNEYGIPGLILDVRDNGGGLGMIALYMAGSFYDEPFILFENELMNEDGVAVPVGFDYVQPVAPRFEFPIALIIDESCASACEIFAAAIAHNPDNLIVGYTPTAGVEAGIFTWALPGGLSFQASIQRVTIDGEVAVEGEGVPPTLLVPRTRANLLNPEDELLSITEEALIPVIIDFLDSLPEDEEPEPDLNDEEEEPDADDDSGAPPAETERP
ncbi:MAG: PDZ domain-containing protein [Thermomicrobiales bacterium]|nr:PDZ domain-containing protein [Thermomicrobiales bacterium]